MPAEMVDRGGARPMTVLLNLVGASDWPPEMHIHGLPVRALGTVLPAAAHEARQIAESVLAALGGDHTYWWNVQTDDERRALIGAGGILINGPSIGADCPELMGEQELA